MLTVSPPSRVNLRQWFDSQPDPHENRSVFARCGNSGIPFVHLPCSVAEVALYHGLMYVPEMLPTGSQRRGLQYGVAKMSRMRNICGHSSRWNNGIYVMCGS